MTAPWLSIIGIGEDGVAGLSAAARTALSKAEIVLGGDRHHDLGDTGASKRLTWPSPFDAMIETIREYRGRRLSILATGDPLWYSVGARIASAIPPAEINFYPQISAFQWAACRMGWSLADVETVTVHGRPVEQVVPRFWPGVRLLVLTAGSHTPVEIARLLSSHGYGESEMTVLANLGGPEETRIDGSAAHWAGEDVSLFPPFHTLAIHCIGVPEVLLPGVPGLPDSAFRHDGKMTKREIRALTLAKLMPARGEVLWDIGIGCGSVAIEWMRAAPDAAAIGFDANPERLSLARANADQLGVPALSLVEGAAPAILSSISAPEGTKPDFRTPNAVFIGGGLAEETVDLAISRLSANGRLVANAVTLESEAVLLVLWQRHGGELTRLSAARAAPVGGLTGWRPAMPVTQWNLMT